MPSHFSVRLSLSLSSDTQIALPIQWLQWTDLENSWASSDAVVSNSGVTAGQDDVGLAGDRCRSCRRFGDSNRKASINSGGPGKTISSWFI